MRRFIAASVALASAAALTVMSLAVPAGAAGVFVVPCSGTGGGEAGLVAAINAANASAGATTISLAQGCTYNIASVHDFMDGGGLPAITSTVAIGPPQPTPVTKIRRPDSAPAFGLVNVDAGANLTLSNVTVTGGLAPDGFVGAGVGVAYGATATLYQVRVTANRAVANTSAVELGGGIYNAGSLTLLYSQVDHNSVIDTARNALAVGGGIVNEGVDAAHAATLVLFASHVDHNTVTAAKGSEPGAVGGGIATLGVASTQLSVSDVSNNTVTSNGKNSAALGAGLFDNLSFFSGNADTRLTVFESSIEHNTATAGKGFGAGAGLYSAAGDHTALGLGTVIEQNSASTDGGGMYLEVRGTVVRALGSVISGNTPNNCGPPANCP